MTNVIFDQLNKMQDEDQYDFLYQEIIDIVTSISGLSPDLFEPTTPFMSLGIDSIMGVEIAKELGKKLSLTLQNTLIWTYPYMDTLTKHLLNEVINSTNAVNNSF